MANKEHERIRDFDNKLTTNHIKILKTSIPYMETTKQKYVSIYIKYLELMYAISFFQNDPPHYGICSLENEALEPLDLLVDVREFCSDEEQGFIDSMQNMLNTFQMFNTYQSMMQTMGSENSGGGGSDPFDMIKGMLSPEQQSMFDMFKTMQEV